MALPAPLAPDVPGRRFMIGVVAFTVVAMTAYWVVWFGVDRDILAAAHTESYYAFENAFPVADAWITANAVGAFIALLRRRASVLFWCIAGGASSVYLGLLDVSFDFENGIYRSGDTGGIAVEITINVLTLALGVVVTAWAWRHRRALASYEGF